MILMVCDATKSAKSRMTTSAISATTGGPPVRGLRGWRSGARGSRRDQRGRAADRDDLDAGAGDDDLVLVVGARGPDLAVDAHRADALVVGDALQDDRRAP